jgi:putative peptide zinc metalloprotease protein
MAEPGKGQGGGKAQDLWQHVSGLRPSLRRHVRVLAQDYRGERWYLLHDETAGRFTRFNASAYAVLGRLDGDLTMQEILELANTVRADDEKLTPDDLLQILAQLHAAEVLRGGFPLSAQDVLNRYETAQRYQRRGALRNPLALRFPLFDPDRLLDRLAPLARVLFAWPGLVVWLLVAVSGGLLAVANAPQLAAAVTAKTLSPGEILAFWLLYPVVKVLHELGHGLAVKAWGGEVHETGINLLVFMPVPYVDASASWAFRDKRRRALVGAAGILVELFLAALGIVVWVVVEPGLVQDTALNLALIGGISTLLFNGNPLLRFDGYYVLEDLLEIPNLASRSSRYYLYLIQRYLLGLGDSRSPASARGERGWFIAYGLASPLYRLTVLVGIALYLAGEFLVVGVVLAAWAVLMQIIRPLFRSLLFLATSPRLEARRLRAGGLVAGLLLAGLLLLNWQAPLVTHTEGVVWLHEQGEVHSGIDGFVETVHVASGEVVKEGDVLIELRDGALQSRRAVLEARLAELRTQKSSEQQRSRVKAAMIDDDIRVVAAELAQLAEKTAALQVRSPVTGHFILDDPHGLRGRYVRQGELLGYVVQDGAPVIRTIVSQDEVGLLRRGQPVVEVALADRIDEPLKGRWLREVPAGSSELPNAALGALGGGEFKIDLQDETGRTSTERVFQFDVELPAGTPVSGIGGRAYVRLEHGTEPLWRQWSRSLQQLLLSQLQV